MFGVVILMLISIIWRTQHEIKEHRWYYSRFDSHCYTHLELCWQNLFWAGIGSDWFYLADRKNRSCQRQIPKPGRVIVIM